MEKQQELSRQIAADVEAFLKAGGQITKCKPGESGERDPFVVSRGNGAHNKPVDVGGQRFGQLVALHRTQDRTLCGWWVCQCDCGNKGTYERKTLERGRRTRCDDCAKKEQVKNIIAKKKGMKYVKVSRKAQP